MPSSNRMTYPARLAEIDRAAVLHERAAVDGGRHRDREIAHLLRAADVHRARVLHAFLPKPRAQLEDAYHLGARPLRDRHEVPDVIEMPVGREDRVGSGNLPAIRRTGWILLEPRIDDDALALPRQLCDVPCPSQVTESDELEGIGGSLRSKRLQL